mgnify:CR=1 FL=1
MISFGTPPAFRFDSETSTLSIKITKPDNNDPLIKDIVSQFKHVEKANVALSGGIDSQFALRVACELGDSPLIRGIDKYFLNFSIFSSLSVLSINPSP